MLDGLAPRGWDRRAAILKRLPGRGEETVQGCESLANEPLVLIKRLGGNSCDSFDKKLPCHLAGLVIDNESQFAELGHRDLDLGQACRTPIELKHNDRRQPGDAARYHEQITASYPCHSINNQTGDHSGYYSYYQLSDPTFKELIQRNCPLTQVSLNRFCLSLGQT